jgi:CRP/FNR family cyclic AMP-dependent transcriptional regulator
MTVQAVKPEPHKLQAPAAANRAPAAALAGTWFAPLLQRIDRGKSEVALRKGARLYSQGQKADAVYFIERGKVRLSVLSSAGKEAILGVLNAGEFCGEGCLAGQLLRIDSAAAISPVAAIRVQKDALVQALHEQHPLSEAFLARLLMRNMAFEEDICDQLFNHSEKRLARALLKLARVGLDASGAEDNVITPKVSQEFLAEMIGATRGRVNFFMNKFRRLGLIEYKGETHVHAERLTEFVLSGQEVGVRHNAGSGEPAARKPVATTVRSALATDNTRGTASG